MSRYRSSYRPNFYYDKPLSVYMAEKHIEEAKKLQEELGSSIQDVKEYLYSLSDSDLDLILIEYEKLILSRKKRKNLGELNRQKNMQEKH